MSTESTSMYGCPMSINAPRTKIPELYLYPSPQSSPVTSVFLPTPEPSATAVDNILSGHSEIINLSEPLALIIRCQQHVSYAIRLSEAPDVVSPATAGTQGGGSGRHMKIRLLCANKSLPGLRSRKGSYHPSASIRLQMRFPLIIGR